MGDVSTTMFTSGSGGGSGTTGTIQFVQDAFTDITDLPTVNTGLTDNANTNPLGNKFLDDNSVRYGIKTLMVSQIVPIQDRSKWLVVAGSVQPTWQIVFDESYPQIQAYAFGAITTASKFGQLNLVFGTQNSGICINGVMSRAAFILNPDVNTEAFTIYVDGVSESTGSISAITGDAAFMNNQNRYYTLVHSASNETNDIHDIRLVCTSSTAINLFISGIQVYYQNSGSNINVQQGNNYVNKQKVVSTVGASMPLASYGSSLGGKLLVYQTSSSGVTYSALSCTTLGTSCVGTSGTNLLNLFTGTGASFAAGYGVITYNGSTMYVGIIQSMSTDTATVYPTLSFGISAQFLYRTWNANATVAINASFHQLSQVLDFGQQAKRGLSEPIFGPKNSYAFWGNNTTLSSSSSGNAVSMYGGTGVMVIEGYFTAAEVEFSNNNSTCNFTVSINGLPAWSYAPGTSSSVGNKKTLFTDAGSGWNSVQISAGASNPSAAGTAIDIAKFNMYTRKADPSIAFGRLAELETLQTFTDRGAVNATFINPGTYRRIYADQLPLFSGTSNWVKIAGITYAAGSAYQGSTAASISFQYYGKNVALIGTAATNASLIIDSIGFPNTFNTNIVVPTEGFHTLTYTLAASSGTCTINAIDFAKSLNELKDLRNFSAVGITSALVAVPTPGPRSQLELNNVASLGTTDTHIPFFTIVSTFVGTAFRLEQNNAANGTWIRICEDGIYFMSFVYAPTAADQAIAITKNANALQRTQSPGTFTPPINGGLPVLVYVDGATVAANPTWTGILKAGDIIRPHVQTNTSSASNCSFNIVKIGN